MVNYFGCNYKWILIYNHPAVERSIRSKKRITENLKARVLHFSWPCVVFTSLNDENVLQFGSESGW